jgi:hypothetical protein
VSANYIRAAIHPTARGLTTNAANVVVSDNASTAKRKLDIVGLRLAVAF